MRILHVLAGARHGGAETACIDAAIAMKDAGHEIIVATRPNAERVPRLKKAGIPVHTFPFGGAIDVYTPFALRRVLKKTQPEIVQTWMSRAAQKVTRWDQSMGIPPYVVVSRLGGYYKIKNFANTDYFATITPDIKRYLVEECDVPANKVRHINNFAETDADVTQPINRIAEGVPDNATLCLGLGRLHKSKAFDTLIKAVHAAGSDFHLWIAGEGPDRKALEKLIKELNVQGRVRLLGWRDDRAALFQAADICTFSSRYEPFGTVFVQAWAHHTPLVTTDADGPKQFVNHGSDGMIVKIDDVDAMSTAIKRVAQDSALRQKLVEQGRWRYQNEFTRDKMVTDYIDFFNAIRIKSKTA